MKNLLLPLCVVSLTTGELREPEQIKEAQEEIQKFITALESDEFIIRHEAGKKFLKWSSQHRTLILDLLPNAIKKAPGPEERARLEHIAKTLYFSVGTPSYGFRFVKTETTEVQQGGLTVLSVTEGAAAERGGLLAGDLVIELNSIKIAPLHDQEDIASLFLSQSPGEKVKLHILRKGKALILNIRPDKKKTLVDPDSPQAQKAFLIWLKSQTP